MGVLKLKPEETLPPGWRGPLDDYMVLHGGSLSARSLANYIDSLCQLHKFLGDTAPNLEDIKPRMVAAFLDYTAKNASPVTAAMRFRGLRAVFNAMSRKDEDGESLLERSPMAGVKAPRAVEPPLPVLAIEDIKRVIAKIREGRSAEDRRDEAIVRVLFSTGVRRGELVSMKIDAQSLNLRAGTVAVTGKTGPRLVQFDEDTAKSVFKWMQARRKIRAAENTDALWVGNRGALTPNGVFQAIADRFAKAGVEARHALHVFRHTWAHLYRLNGGNDSDLIASGGWSSGVMTLRYGKSASQERARKAQREMGLGKLLR